jgi:DNA-binding transcriptional MerR regulator
LIYISTKQLCRAFQITARQIQWWCDEGLVSCETAGHARRFDLYATFRALVIRDMRRKGASLKCCRAVLRALKTSVPEHGPKPALCLDIAKTKTYLLDPAALVGFIGKYPGSLAVVAIDRLEAEALQVFLANDRPRRSVMDSVTFLPGEPIAPFQGGSLGTAC